MNLEDLKRGQLLSISEIERITGRKCPSDPANSVNWRRDVIGGLKARIEGELNIVCREEDGQIRLLHEAEASDYLHHRVEAHVLGLSRSSSRLVMRDSREMTEADQIVHDHRCRVASALAVSARRDLEKSRTDGKLRRVGQADEDLAMAAEE